RAARRDPSWSKTARAAPARRRRRSDRGRRRETASETSWSRARATAPGSEPAGIAIPTRRDCQSRGRETATRGVRPRLHVQSIPAAPSAATPLRSATGCMDAVWGRRVRALLADRARLPEVDTALVRLLPPAGAGTVTLLGTWIDAEATVPS